MQPKTSVRRSWWTVCRPSLSKGAPPLPWPVWPIFFQPYQTSWKRCHQFLPASCPALASLLSPAPAFCLHLQVPLQETRRLLQAATKSPGQAVREAGGRKSSEARDGGVRKEILSLLRTTNGGQRHAGPGAVLAIRRGRARRGGICCCLHTSCFPSPGWKDREKQEGRKEQEGKGEQEFRTDLRECLEAGRRGESSCEELMWQVRLGTVRRGLSGEEWWSGLVHPVWRVGVVWCTLCGEIGCYGAPCVER